MADRNHRLLVVDNDPALCASLVAGLSEDGSEVHCAYDGSQALAMLKGGGFDLVLTDVVLPGAIKGEVLAAAALEMAIQVVLMSGALDAEDYVVRHKVPLLRKPFRLSTLRAVLMAVLAASR